MKEITCTRCDKPIEASSIQEVTQVRNGQPYCSEQCASTHYRDPRQIELPFGLKPAEPTGYMNY